MESASVSSPKWNITVCSLDGSNPSVIENTVGGLSPYYPSWSSFFGPRTFIGSLGALMPSSSGFL